MTYWKENRNHRERINAKILTGLAALTRLFPAYLIYDNYKRQIMVIGCFIRSPQKDYVTLLF